MGRGFADFNADFIVIGFMLAWGYKRLNWSLDFSQRELFCVLLNPCVHGGKEGLGLPFMPSC